MKELDFTIKKGICGFKGQNVAFQGTHMSVGFKTTMIKMVL